MASTSMLLATTIALGSSAMDAGRTDGALFEVGAAYMDEEEDAVEILGGGALKLAGMLVGGAEELELASVGCNGGGGGRQMIMPMSVISAHSKHEGGILDFTNKAPAAPL